MDFKDLPSVDNICVYNVGPRGHCPPALTRFTLDRPTAGGACCEDIDVAPEAVQLVSRARALVPLCGRRGR